MLLARKAVLGIGPTTPDLKILFYLGNYILQSEIRPGGLLCQCKPQLELLVTKADYCLTLMFTTHLANAKAD